VKGLGQVELSLPGSSGGTAPGEPDLGQYGQLFQVPSGSRLRLVIDEVDWVAIAGSYLLTYTDQLRATGTAKKDEDAYKRDCWFPSQPVNIDYRVFGERELVGVSYYAVAYNPARRALRAARRVRCHVEITVPEPKAPIPEKKAEAQSPVMRALSGLLPAALASTCDGTSESGPAEGEPELAGNQRCRILGDHP
jgi:hypothetical protein